MYRSEESLNDEIKRLNNDLEARLLADLFYQLPTDRKIQLMSEKLQKEVYSPEEVATLLGKSIETVRRWLRAGTLRGVKIGRGWHIPKEEITRILKGNS